MNASLSVICITTLLIFLFTTFLVTSAAEPRRSLYSKIYSKYEGDIYIAGLFSIHHSNGLHGCGRMIDQDGLQVITAAIYGLEMVRARLGLPLRIGLLSIDTCQDPEYGILQSKDFMLFKSCKTSETYSCSDNSVPVVKEEYLNLQRIFGIFGAGNSDVSIMAATLLRLVDLPQISYFSTTPELSEESKYPGFFRTIPSDHYAVRAIAELLRRYDWNFILLVNDDSKYSLSTMENFKVYVQTSNTEKDRICIFNSVMIKKDSSYDNLTDIMETIKANTNKEKTPKVVVTFLTQAVVEQVLEHLELHPVEEFKKLLWIGTDSWGGRTWPNVTKDNPLMNNTIAIIPRAYKMADFENYYKSRLPSVDDYNPWLARRFESVCGCEYSNTSMFIYPELRKMRKPNNESRPCEPIEGECAKEIYKGSVQMPYIHYVMDGILAYAHAVRTLIGSMCTGLNDSDCSALIWSQGVLDLHNVTAQLKSISFTDSTNETFSFWKSKDGAPAYSMLYFNKTSQIWDNLGALSVRNQSSTTFEIVIDGEFDRHLKASNHFARCSEDCPSGSIRQYLNIKCCWRCQVCLQPQYVDNATETCLNCTEGHHSLDGITCRKNDERSMNFSELGAMIILLADLIGLLYCFFAFVIMMAFWNTPIIKAFGKETSSIILLGTILSFAFSMYLLSTPTKGLCYLSWFSPGFCSTVCYASILTKTNRIVRIFGMNWSSKSRSSPKFISPMSQVSIIGCITLLESIILIVVIVQKDLSIETRSLPNYKTEVLCQKMDAGSLVSTFLIPILLLIISTFYAFKMRKTPDGFNETRNLNFMNFANCVVLVTSLFLYQLLTNYEAVYPLCLQMSFGAFGNLIGLFTPKIYLVLCHPERNTLEAVTARSRSRSQVSFSQPNTPMGDITFMATLGHARCRKCNTFIHESLNLDGTNTAETSSTKRKSTAPKSPAKVFFIDEDVGQTRHNIEGNTGEPNAAYIHDF